MKKLALLITTFSLLAAAAPAMANHSWGGYHWARSANPFTVNLGDNMSASWKPYLATTSGDWSAQGPSPLNTTIVAGRSNKRCAATLGRVEVCNGSYGKNGWLGLAQIWISGGTHITQGTTKMNDSYFSLSKYNNPNEKEHVVCQEVGHTFGLDHQSEDGSSLNTCMDYFSNTGANAGSTLSTHPNAHDYEELGLIYNHLDSTTTLASTPTSAGMAGREGAVAWRTERHDNRHSSVITESFPDDTSRVTVIDWAD